MKVVVLLLNNEWNFRLDVSDLLLLIVFYKRLNHNFIKIKIWKISIELILILFYRYQVPIYAFPVARVNIPDPWAILFFHSTSNMSPFA